MAAQKGYKAGDRIRIEHPKTGEAYGVTGSAFEKTYEGLGFRAISFEDGSPLSLSKAEQEAASRAAAPATANVGPAGAGLAPEKPAEKTKKSTPGRRARSSGTGSSKAGTSPATSGSTAPEA